MNLNPILALALALALALTLAACSAATDPDSNRPGTDNPVGPAPDVSLLSGTVTDYSGPAGTLVAGTAFGSSDDFGRGTIDAQGNFMLDLDDPVPDEELETPPFCADIAVSDPAFRWGVVSGLSVYEGDAFAVGTSLAAEDPRNNPGVYVFEMRIFTDRDVSLQGTCDAGTDEELTLDLDLEAGWNAVRIEAADGPDYYQRLRDGGVPGAQWYPVPESGLIVLE